MTTNVLPPFYGSRCILPERRYSCWKCVGVVSYKRQRYNITLSPEISAVAPHRIWRVNLHYVSVSLVQSYSILIS